MDALSRFATLTNRYVSIQERTKRFISDLWRLIRLLEHDISYEEERTGIFNVTNSNYSLLARQLRIRRDNLAATISKLGHVLINRQRCRMFAALLLYCRDRNDTSSLHQILPASPSKTGKWFSLSSGTNAAFGMVLASSRPCSNGTSWSLMLWETIVGTLT